MPIQSEMYAFARDARDGVEAAQLWMCLRTGQGAHVSNCFPQRQGGHFEADEFNALLAEFGEELQKSREPGVQLDFGPEFVDIGHWLSPQAAKLLRSFSGLANKSSGSSHPYDQRRWFAFILVAHREHAPLRPHTLVRWLIEAEHWPEDAAEKLGREYDLARDILEAAEE